MQFAIGPGDGFPQTRPWAPAPNALSNDEPPPRRSQAGVRSAGDGPGARCGTPRPVMRVIVDGGRVFVQILVTDRAISSSDCDTWSRGGSVPPVVVDPSFGAGTYRLNAERDRAFTARAAAAVSLGGAQTDHRRVRRNHRLRLRRRSDLGANRPTEFGFHTDVDCDTWTRVTRSPVPSAPWSGAPRRIAHLATPARAARRRQRSRCRRRAPDGAEPGGTPSWASVVSL